VDKLLALKAKQMKGAAMVWRVFMIGIAILCAYFRLRKAFRTWTDDFASLAGRLRQKKKRAA
jgi:hypothetical protein